MTNISVLDNEAQKIVAKYEQKSAATLPLLHLAQDHAGYVTPEAEAWVSKWTEVPVIHVHEAATFYSMYRFKPAGKHHIRFCTTTSCVLKGSEQVLEYLKNKIGTENGGISLEEVECLCACEMAPMMQVDGKYHGDLTEKKIDEILSRFK